jgi:2-C-methyl-D-erythritol 4-phosphate cytidylyltransferase/2-C-methyl-D-erythritol 2,4-cyclodiphosphate synthase
MTKKKDNAYILLACAGSGARAGLPYNKLLYKVNGKAIVEYTLENFYQCGTRNTELKIIVLCSESDKAAFQNIIRNPSVEIVVGGKTRAESVKNGLQYIKEKYNPRENDIVLICDGARPNCTSEIIKRCAESAAKYGSGIAAVPVADTVKTAENDIITSTPNRKNLFAAQTPQAFNFNLICGAYALAGKEADNLTDDAAVLEKFGKPETKVRLVEGNYENYKITTMEDIKRFQNGRTQGAEIRIGMGSDTHCLFPDKKLILGGVAIPHPLGLLGHSDADALAHSVIDALLSAAGLRDIGFYFPDTDPAFKNADSIGLLKKTAAMLKETGITVINISSVIHAQKPKMSPHIPKMCENLAAALNIGKERISISAKTGEGVSVIGEEIAVRCESICLISLS